jgi:hypothetical protein
MYQERRRVAPHYIQDTGQPASSEMLTPVVVDVEQDFARGGEGGGTLVCEWRGWRLGRYDCGLQQEA